MTMHFILPVASLTGAAVCLQGWVQQSVCALHWQNSDSHCTLQENSSLALSSAWANRLRRSHSQMASLTLNVVFKSKPNAPLFCHHYCMLTSSNVAALCTTLGVASVSLCSFTPQPHEILGALQTCFATADRTLYVS